MKALVKARAEPGLGLEDVPVPALGRDDVLIRVLRTGVCGTDLHIFQWDGWAQANVPVPLVIGHEFVGEVVDIGSDVQELRQGDLVSGEGHLVCGRCRNCMAGRRVQCAHTKGVGVNHPARSPVHAARNNVWRHRGHRLTAAILTPSATPCADPHVSGPAMSSSPALARSASWQHRSR
jgi:threonine 3-dehydrogenase